MIPSGQFNRRSNSAKSRSLGSEARRFERAAQRGHDSGVSGWHIDADDSPANVLELRRSYILVINRHCLLNEPTRAEVSSSTQFGQCPARNEFEKFSPIKRGCAAPRRGSFALPAAGAAGASGGRECVPEPTERPPLRNSCLRQKVKIWRRNFGASATASRLRWRLGTSPVSFALEEVTRLLSRFADSAIDAAVEAAIRERVPDAEPKGFGVIAMGKLGSHELNYSSDVDLLLLFDPDELPRRTRDEPGEAAVRIGRRLIELLQKRTADGYVERVDLRLRPSPEVTPIALPAARRNLTL